MFQYHEVPRRVFLQLKPRDVLMSDYLFPGEGPTDCCQSFCDILGVQCAEEEIDEEKEGVFGALIFCNLLFNMILVLFKCITCPFQT